MTNLPYTFYRAPSPRLWTPSISPQPKWLSGSLSLILVRRQCLLGANCKTSSAETCCPGRCCGWQCRGLTLRFRSSREAIGRHFGKIIGTKPSLLCSLVHRETVVGPVSSQYACGGPAMDLRVSSVGLRMYSSSNTVAGYSQPLTEASVEIPGTASKIGEVG